MISDIALLQGHEFPRTSASMVGCPASRCEPSPGTPFQPATADHHPCSTHLFFSPRPRAFRRTACAHVCRGPWQIFWAPRLLGAGRPPPTHLATVEEDCERAKMVIPARVSVANLQPPILGTVRAGNDCNWSPTGFPHPRTPHQPRLKRRLSAQSHAEDRPPSLTSDPRGRTIPARYESPLS